MKTFRRQSTPELENAAFERWLADGSHSPPGTPAPTRPTSIPSPETAKNTGSQDEEIRSLPPQPHEGDPRCFTSGCGRAAIGRSPIATWDGRHVPRCAVHAGDEVLLPLDGAALDAPISRALDDGIDPETGELLSTQWVDGPPAPREVTPLRVHSAPSPKTRRKRRALTDEEHAVRADREKRKPDYAAFRALIEQHDPPVDGDPPIYEERLTDISNLTIEPLARFPQLSGRGNAGTTLVVRAQHYGGLNGGKAGDYLAVFVEFHDAQCHKVRSRGVKIREEHVPELIAVLQAWSKRKR